MNAIDTVAWFVYLLSAVMFVIGLHFMNSPKTARRGNLISAAGMVIAVIMAFVRLFVTGYRSTTAIVLLLLGILIGAVAGVVSAKKVKMTDMPQLVSIFNTVGGGAAALVALNDILTPQTAPSLVVLITAGLGVVIGSVTFTGSLVAAGKLQGVKFLRKLTIPGKGLFNVLFIVLTVASFVILCVQPDRRLLWAVLTALCVVPAVLLWNSGAKAALAGAAGMGAAEVLAALILLNRATEKNTVLPE